MKRLVMWIEFLAVLSTTYGLAYGLRTVSVHSRTFALGVFGVILLLLVCVGLLFRAIGNKSDSTDRVTKYVQNGKEHKVCRIP
jgi:hypothetical protein